MNNNENYVNDLGVFRATVKRCFERGPIKQSKAACYIEFERITDKAIVSMRFSNPLNASDLYRISKVVHELKGKFMKAEELKSYGQEKIIAFLNKFAGERVNIYVRPHELPGFKKVIWGVEDVVHGKFSALNANDNGPSLPSGDSALPSLDDLSKADEDIPF